ncbi:MAG: amidohydrolase family protein [Chthoniobacterales bacterium]
MIIRARSVVTMDGAPIANGAVVVNGNKIATVDEWETVRRENSGDVIDLGECALLPGLINAHCHLDYTGLRGKIPRRPSFTDWIRAINTEKAKLTPDDYVRAINEGFAEALLFGTTSIANLTGFPELISRVRAPIRTWWLAELINIRNALEPENSVEETLRLLPASSEGIGLAPHAPYTASAELYRCCEKAAKGRDILLTTHLAESKEEMMMSFDRGGPLAEFLDSISQDLFEYNGMTPVEHLSEFCHLDERWLLVHVNEILPSDFNRLGKGHIVHCPRSHAYFEHTPFEFAKLREHGINICLGTDSLASNDDLSLFAEMRQLRKTEPLLSGRDLLELATINPARALRRENSLGRLRAGHRADLIAVPCHADDENIYDEVVEFEDMVPWMLIDGVRLETP